MPKIKDMHSFTKNTIFLIADVKNSIKISIMEDVKKHNNFLYDFVKKMKDILMKFNYAVVKGSSLIMSPSNSNFYAIINQAKILFCLTKKKKGS
jgi:ribosomal protein S8